MNETFLTYKKVNFFYLLKKLKYIFFFSDIVYFSFILNFIILKLKFFYLK